MFLTLHLCTGGTCSSHRRDLISDAEYEQYANQLRTHSEFPHGLCRSFLGIYYCVIMALGNSLWRNVFIRSFRYRLRNGNFLFKQENSKDGLIRKARLQEANRMHSDYESSERMGWTCMYAVPWRRTMHAYIRTICSLPLVLLLDF